MEEAQTTIDGAQSFLDKVQGIWDGFTKLVGNIPGINGSLEDIIGGLIIAAITGAIGFGVYSLVNG